MQSAALAATRLSACVITPSFCLPGTLMSSADGRRHRELYRGTSSGGEKWTWEPLTANSTADNLRPLVPKWKDPRTALIWMRGTYTHNRGEWTTAVSAMILPPSARRLQADAAQYSAPVSTLDSLKNSGQVF